MEPADLLETDVKDLPEAPQMTWENPPSPKDRHLTADIMPFGEFTKMRKRIGGRNALVPKTTFDVDALQHLKENNDIVKSFEGGIVFSSFSMEPESLVFLMEAIDMYRPQVILELGAGLSTLILSDHHRKLLSNGAKKPRYITIEQSEEHLEKVQEMAEHASVENYFKSVVFPLVRYKIGDEYALDEKAMGCYDFDEKALHDALDGMRPDMIIVDGPIDQKSVSGASMAKVLTLPILQMYMAPGGVVFMDGAYGDNEIFAAEQWHKSGAAHMLGVKAVGKGMFVGLKPGQE